MRLLEDKNSWQNIRSYQLTSTCSYVHPSAILTAEPNSLAALTCWFSIIQLSTAKQKPLP